MKYLFLGDAGTSIEEELSGLNLEVDAVKVGHHGSKTSTSPAFYQMINPKYAFIETGRRKQFGFPSSEVINTLSKCQVYRTDLDYTIVVSFNRYHISIRKTKKDF